MDIKTYMQNQGYSRRATNHIVLEQDGKLWLAYASQGLAGFMASASQGAGLLEINIMSGGESVAYDYSATESGIKVTFTGGAMTITVDRDADALRFAGRGAALRLDAKQDMANVSSLNIPEGVELSAGGGHFVFTPVKGRIEFDDTWLRNKFHSIKPVVDLIPDGDEFELAVFDLPAETEIPKITKSVDECIKENGDDFAAFCTELVNTPETFSALRENIAYLLWINHKKQKDGTEIIVGNKLRSPEANPWMLAAVSLAFNCVKKCIGLITAFCEKAPPVHGLAALRLFEDGMFNTLSRADIIKLNDTLNVSSRRWDSERACRVPDLRFYAYRFETGIAAPKLFSAGEPVAAPDLNAYLLLQNEALSLIADHLYDGGEAINRKNRAKAALGALIGNLWNGEDFTGMNIYTRAKSEPDAVLSYIPLVLGKRLPADITDILAKKLNADDMNSILGTLVIRGLYDAGKTEEAKAAASKLVEKAKAEGVNCPYYGAALLALAAKCSV